MAASQQRGDTGSVDDAPVALDRAWGLLRARAVIAHPRSPTTDPTQVTAQIRGLPVTGYASIPSTLAAATTIHRLRDCRARSGRQPADTGAVASTSVPNPSLRDLPCPAERPFEYGLGVVDYDLAGQELVGHDGSSGTIVVHDRDRDLTIAILTNGGEQDIGAFFEAVINAIETDG